MAKNEFTADFRANPLQRRFIESRARADLFSSRVGEGKSAGLCWSVFYHTRHNPGASWVVIRDTWENLQRSTMKEFFKWFPPGIAGSWHQTKKEFTWNEGLARGSVVFLGLDDPGDASKLMSQELAGIAIDEPAPAAESGGVDELIFDIGFTRLRQSGMNWYAVKLAENNPDESHWTYRRFVEPGDPEFAIWQPQTPENEKNLPDSFYEDVRRRFSHRPDLVRRFVEGKFGFQQIGQAVTPEWDDARHIARGLFPIKGTPLHLLWDFGLNSTCLFTQLTSLGNWNVLDACVGDGSIGVEQLIEERVKPLLASRYRGFKWSHIGDPAGMAREQSDARVSAVRLLTKSLGGVWRPGPVKWAPRIEPLRAVLNRGRCVQVDPVRAKEVWHALRGGWHYHVARTGLVSAEAKKDAASHPGDAMSYGAAILFPLVPMMKRGAGQSRPKPATFFGQDRSSVGARPGLKLPGDGKPLPKGPLGRNG